MTNDVPLNAFSVGFKYHSDDIQASSVQNEPELQLPTAPGIFFVRLYPESNLVAVGWLNYNEYYPLPIHNSPTHVFTIWFQNTGSFSGACIDIDSSYTPSAGYWHYIYQLHQKELFPAYFDCDTCDLIGSLCVCGDADISGRIDVTDVVFMVNYIFGSGPGPSIQSLCDVDCSNRIDVTDCVYLINFIFAAGAVPCAACAK